MAYLVERHFNETCDYVIPEYWVAEPEGREQMLPYATKEDAESAEKHLADPIYKDD